MSFIGDMFNSKKGAGYEAQGTQIQSPVTKDQAGLLYNQVQGGLGAQADLMGQLAAQHGIQNQSNVFNQQQDLANQLGLQAQGQGPNPALAQLANTTGQNVAQQASLMGGQRGATANPALLARMAAQQGAGIQQQSAGQAAVLRAQQQLAAQQALQQQQGMMGNLATNQVGQQAGAVGNYNQFLQGEQGQLLNSIAGQNQSNVANQSNVNNANAHIAAGNAAGQWKILNKAAGAGGTAMGMAEGGQVPGPQSFVGKHVSKMSQGGVADYRSGGHIPGKAKVKGDSVKNDTVPAVLSPGEVVIPRSVMNSKDPSKNAADFVNAILAKKNMRKAK